MSMNCAAAGELLLDHVYGALDDAEDAAVQRHLDGCASCRLALEKARGQRDLFAAAARTETPDLRLAPPKPPLFTRRRLAVAAAALVACTAGAFAWRDVEVRAAEARYPHVAVLAPSAVNSGRPAEFLVDVTTVRGAPLPASVRLDVYGSDQRRVATKTVATAADGKARLVFDPGLGTPGEQLRVEVAASLAGGVERHASTIVIREGTRLLARVATDKPLYRPGETVRVRSVALERFRLTPAGNVPMLAEVLDPRGAKVAAETLYAADGVAAWEWAIPEGAAGGEYKLVLTGGDAAHPQFPKTERTFVVRSYRVPRIKGEVTLDRDSYGPSDEGKADVTIERAEGGVPVGAALDAVVTVDGVEVHRETQTLSASGRVTVKFALPKEIAEGRGQIAVVVKDGGVVETVAKTIPVSLGRLDAEFFPEGGDLVAGLTNRVYFRVKTPTGEPADLVADVVDASGAKVAEARVDDLGMGRLEFAPEAGARYRLVATKPAGIKIAGEFPKAVESGVVLRALDDVTAAGKPIRVEVAATRGGRHLLSAYCRGVLVAQDTVELAAGERRLVELKPTADVGGVVRVTAFDAAGVPRAERLVSLAPAHRIELDVRPSATKASPGETVKVEITARDEHGKPVVATLGVSVVDEAMLKLANDENTASFPLHFLLGLEVEELEKAEVFASGEHAARAADRLLGVQGWRRFAWKTPVEFLAQQGDKGPRVVVADARDVPQHADNLADATSAVEWDRRDADKTLRGLGAACAVGVAFVLGLVALLTGRVAKRARPVIGGLLALGVVVAVVAMNRSTMEAGAVACKAEIAWDGQPRLPEASPAPPRVDEVDLPQTGGPADWPITIRCLTFQLDGQIDVDGAGGVDGGANFALLAVQPGPAVAKDIEAARGFLEKFKEKKADFRDAREELQRVNRVRVLARVYAHRKQPSADGARTDFAEVLYWNPLLVTDAAGKATFDFDTSDSITTFAVGVDAHDARGALSTGAGSLQNRVPFFLEPKLPIALSAGDKLELPVVVGNDTDAALDVFVDVRVAGGLLVPVVYEEMPSAHVAPGARGRAIWRMTAAQGQGAAAVTVVGRAGRLSDKSVRTILVQPRGFPIDLAKAGVLEKRDAFVLTLPADFDRSTLAASLRLYPSTLSSLEDGLDAMLQEPCGCFEQTSSSNYPNVLVLNYLNETDHAPAAVVKRAKELLARGYQKLTGYECKQKGYEWFGGDPGHEALSAYGLVEFTDMAKVHPVDAAMVARTRDWLLSRRDGKGGFLRNANSCDTFGGAPAEITDAYVVCSLLEADRDADVAKELKTLVERALATDDPYVVALAARAASIRRAPETKALLDRLSSMQKPDGRFVGKTTSITSSSGINLDVETTALAALAFVQDPARLPNAESAVRFVVQQRKSGGSFGATQATILALRALCEHARAAKRTSADHDVAVSVNGRVVAQRHVAAGAPGAIVFEKEILDALVAGENRIELTDSSAETLPWAMAGRYFAKLPANDPDCAIDVTTKLAKDVVSEGETVRLDVTIANRRKEGVPMTLARVGLPAGLEAREDQLKELKKSGAIDFYETRPREVTLYFRGLAPEGVKKLALDLVAAIPGEFEGPASSAYLYYGDDKKTWAAPLRVRIEAAK